MVCAPTTTDQVLLGCEHLVSGNGQICECLRSQPKLLPVSNWKFLTHFPASCLFQVKEMSQGKQSHLSLLCSPINLPAPFPSAKLTLQPEGRWMRDSNQILNRSINHSQLWCQLEGTESVNCLIKLLSLIHHCTDCLKSPVGYMCKEQGKEASSQF